MTKIERGWYKVYGNMVYVENNKVLWGLASNGLRTVYAYEKSELGSYDCKCNPSVEVLRNGLKNGTIVLA